MADGNALDAFAARDDLRTAIADWLSWLALERRVARHTFAAYSRDLAGFLAFLQEYRGETPGIAVMAELAPTEFRAYLARRAHDGVARSSTARAMSTLRGFFRFLDKTGRVHNPAIKAVKTPRLPESIPRPLDKDDARSVIEKIAEFSMTPWIQLRDVALFTLLYGCGLRIDEALGLDRRQAPTGEAVAITGTPMRGKMSTGIRRTDRIPKPKMSTAMTMKVSGRVRATRTSAIIGRDSQTEVTW